MTYSEAFKAATGFFRSLERSLKDEDNLDVWEATLVDWDNQHPEMGEVMLEKDHPHPEVQVDNTHLTLYYREVSTGESRWQVVLDERRDRDSQFWYFDDLRAAKDRIKKIVNTWTTSHPRGERYGSREREARLRQEERR